MRWLLERRYGLAVDAADGDADLAAGRLATGGYTAFVVPDGSLPHRRRRRSRRIQAWVRAGGTLVGVRGEGIALAQSAGDHHGHGGRRPPTR